MALVTCSECGREISDKAPACPHCGCPRPATEGTQVSVLPDRQQAREGTPHASSTRERGKSKGLVLLVALLAGLGLLAAVVGVAITVVYSLSMTDDERTQKVLLDAANGRLPMTCMAPSATASEMERGTETCVIGADEAYVNSPGGAVIPPDVAISQTQHRKFHGKLYRLRSEPKQWSFHFGALGFTIDALAPPASREHLFTRSLPSIEPRLRRKDEVYLVTQGRLQGHFLIALGSNAFTFKHQFVLVSPEAVNGTLDDLYVRDLRVRGTSTSGAPLPPDTGEWTEVASEADLKKLAGTWGVEGMWPWGRLQVKPMGEEDVEWSSPYDYLLEVHASTGDYDCGLNTMGYPHAFCLSGADAAREATMIRIRTSKDRVEVRVGNDDPVVMDWLVRR
jgi:hypothetical protein